MPRANAPLDDLAKLFGFPGKLGMDGGKVWEAWQAGKAAEIRDYCETDVINTYLVYNRFRRLRGELTAAEEAAERRVRQGAPGAHRGAPLAGVSRRLGLTVPGAAL
jgi:predicted PolB exonuclease-like 3'-5' exonuclease